MRKIRSADHLTDEESVKRTEISESRQQFRRWQAAESMGIYLCLYSGLMGEGFLLNIRP